MIVLDASALVDVIIDQPAKEEILTHLDQPIAAPAHQLVEVLSALARLVRAGGITAVDARAALDEAVALDQNHVTATEGHLRRAFELRERIRVLDGLYVALAEQLHCPLLTTDRRLAGASPPCEVIVPATTGSGRS